MGFGGGNQESSTTFELAPEQRRILDIAMPFFENVRSNPPQPPSGTGIAPFNDLQEFTQMATWATAPTLANFGADAWDASNFLLGGDAFAARPTADFFSGGDVRGSTLSDTQQGELASITSGAAGAGNPALEQTRGIAEGQVSDPTLGMLDMFTSGDLMMPESNPALQATIDAATRPIIEATTQQVLPGIRNEFTGVSGYGGSRQGIAEANSLNSMQRNIGDTAANIATRGYETGLRGTLEGLGLQSQAHQQDTRRQLEAAGLQDTAFGRQLESQMAGLNLGANVGQNELQMMLEGTGIDVQGFGDVLNAQTRALGMAPQTAGLGVLPLSLLGAVGDTQHGMASAQAQEAFQQEQLAQMWDLMLGQEVAGSVGLIPGGTNISQQPTPGMNPFSAILGGLSLFGGLGPMFGFI